MNDETLFHQAQGIPAADRAAFLDRTCGADTALRQRIESLLQAHDNPGSFMAKPLVDAPATLEMEGRDRDGGAQNRSTDAEPIGRMIDRYKLLQQIGEGGFGTVYMAEQLEPVRRKVAVKIIKLGMDTRQVIARFEAERQALAMMDHPNIAKVLDVGSTEAGRPYFVMELVRGIPITEYCDQSNLPVHARLELFIQVCHAVQHAHQKGIIHRDIKPTNVLVTLNDGLPVPKVIDFGVAKATNQQLTEKTLFTAFAQMVGTPLYMSPEQAEMSSLDIDTRSDIYSLGVLLYELLTGTTPFDQTRLRTAMYDEMRRIIREEEPPKPSTRISTLGQARATIAAHRQIDSQRLDKLIKGDLDWIVMKALEKERGRRYDTPSALVRDIQRHFADLPVEARQPTRGYRLKKFVRRNKVGVLAGSAVVAALTVGLVLASIGFVQARREAKRADHEAKVAGAQEQIARKQEEIARTESKRSTEVAHFLTEMLNAPKPWVSAGQDTALLRGILDHAAVRIGTELNEQPEVAAELSGVIGFTYWSIGEFKQSDTIFNQAIERYAGHFGRENARIANLLLNKSLPLRDQQSYAQAEATLREALAITRKTSGDETQEVAWVLRDLGLVLMLANKNPQEAEGLERQALAIRRKVFQNHHKDVADSLVQMTQVLPPDRSAEAEADAREAVEILKNLGTAGTPLPTALYKLAIVLQHEDRLPEAEEAARESVRLMQKAVGKNSPWGVRMLYRLTVILNKEHKYDDLDALFIEYPIPDKGNAVNRCDLLLCRAGRFLSHDKFSDAENDYRQALAMRVGAGRNNPAATSALNGLTKALQAQHKPIDAERLLLEAEENARANDKNSDVVRPED